MVKLLFLALILFVETSSEKSNVSPKYFVYDERKAFLNAVRFLSVEDVVIDLCSSRIDLCPYAIRVYSKTKNHFKDSLIRIAKHESSDFQYTRGKYDKEDLCFMQVNRRVWYDVLPAFFNDGYGVWERLEKNEPHTCVRSAAYIWLYNMATFYKLNGYFPRNIHYREALYHSTEIKKYYVQKLRRVDDEDRL